MGLIHQPKRTQYPLFYKLLTKYSDKLRTKEKNFFLEFIKKALKIPKNKSLKKKFCKKIGKTLKLA